MAYSHGDPTFLAVDADFGHFSMDTGRGNYVYWEDMTNNKKGGILPWPFRPQPIT